MFAALILAAGAGTRFAPGAKLRADLRGKPLVSHVVDAALLSEAADVYVVTGDDDLSDVVPDSVKVVENPHWREGMASSLRRGIEAARDGAHTRVVVALGDQPGLTAEAFNRVGTAPGPIAVADYGDRRGHPVLLASEIWDRLPATGDAGARILLASAEVEVQEVACPGTPVDIDTVDQLRTWT